MKKASMRADEAFAWIARSIVIICGTAFLLVLARLTIKWNDHFQVLGTVERVALQPKEDIELPVSYWNQFLLSYVHAGMKLRVKDVEYLQAKLEQTNYFSNVKLSLSRGVLNVSYSLYRPLAVLDISGSNKSVDSPLTSNWLLYSNARLLPYLQTSSSKQELCLLHMNLDEEVDRISQEALEVAARLLSIFSNPKNSGLAWKCRDINLQAWKGMEHPASEVILKFESDENFSIFVRLGRSRLKNFSSANFEKLIHLLEIALAKKAQWIDARLEDLVIFGYEESSRGEA